MAHCCKALKILFLSFLILLITGFVYASNPNITTSPNPVGSGARALSLGSAFIAVADDATAASWNPAGLIQLNKWEASVVYEGILRRSESLTLDNEEVGLDGDDQNINNKEKDLNFFSLVFPILFDSNPRFNSVLSFSYQKQYDYTREWNFSTKRDFYDEIVNVQQNGYLSTMSFSASSRFFVPCFSIGATLNVWRNFNKNSWEEITTNQKTIKLFDQTTTTDVTNKYTFSDGINFNIGLLWKDSILNPWSPFSCLEGWKYRLGAVFRTPFTGDLKKEVTVEGEEILISDYEMDMPMSYGIGISFQSKDGKKMITTDFTRREWDDYIVKDEEGNEFSPISSLSVDESNIKASNQWRIGFEYIFDKKNFNWWFFEKENVKLPLCLGFFYDQAPAEGGYDEYYGVSFGLGWVWESPEEEKLLGFFRGLSFDIAYQYRYGNNLGGYRTNDSITHNLREQKMYMSTVIYLF